VQTIKLLFKKAEESQTDPHIALLNYRAAPLSGSDKSPAELFLNRRLRTKLPVVMAQLIPTHAEAVREQLVDRQRQQKQFHDRRAHDLPPLKSGDVVRVQQHDELTRGVVTAAHSSPRSFVVETNTVQSFDETGDNSSLLGSRVRTHDQRRLRCQRRRTVQFQQLHSQRTMSPALGRSRFGRRQGLHCRRLDRVDPSSHQLDSRTSSLCKGEGVTSDGLKRHVCCQ
jgi:hypothetical protein